MEEKDFRKMYRESEKRYNKYPVQMAPFEAFRYAKNDGLITEEDYRAAAEFFAVARWIFSAGILFFQLL